MSTARHRIRKIITTAYTKGHSAGSGDHPRNAWVVDPVDFATDAIVGTVRELIREHGEPQLNSNDLYLISLDAIFDLDGEDKDRFNQTL